MITHQGFRKVASKATTFLSQFSISMADVIVLAGNTEMFAELVPTHDAFSDPIYKSSHMLTFLSIKT